MRRSTAEISFGVAVIGAAFGFGLPWFLSALVVSIGGGIAVWGLKHNQLERWDMRFRDKFADHIPALYELIDEAYDRWDPPNELGELPGDWKTLCESAGWVFRPDAIGTREERALLEFAYAIYDPSSPTRGQHLKSQSILPEKLFDAFHRNHRRPAVKFLVWFTRGGESHGLWETELLCKRRAAWAREHLSDHIQLVKMLSYIALALRGHTHKDDLTGKGLPWLEGVLTGGEGPSE